MKTTDWIGLALLGGGSLLLTLYGLVNLDWSEIKPPILIGLAGIFLGSLVLLASALAARQDKEMKNISQEDLRP